MRTKVNLGHPILYGRRQRFCQNFKKKVNIKILYGSEMARNAIESEFRTSKMADGSHFVKFKKKVAYRSEMARNAIESNFWSSKVATGGHLKKKHLHKKLPDENIIFPKTCASREYNYGGPDTEGQMDK